MLFDKGRGFSLIEMVIVLAMVAVLATVSSSAYTNLRAHNNLEIATSSVVEALRLAKSNAEQVHSDSAWGVQIGSGSVVVFAGTSYATRDTSKDRTLALPAGVTVSGLSEVVFEKVRGTTASVGSVTVASGEDSNVITINEKGTLTY